jgi:hypothetical protein
MGLSIEVDSRESEAPIEESRMSMNRRPLVSMGGVLAGAALAPGFRGYGVLGDPGYGLGTFPNSRVDRSRRSLYRTLILHDHP